MRLLPVHEVSGAGEAPKGAIFDAGSQLFTLPDRDDAIVLPPKQRYGRQGVYIAGTVEKVAGLAAPADDVSDRSRERAGRSG